MYIYMGERKGAGNDHLSIDWCLERVAIILPLCWCSLSLSLSLSLSCFFFLSI